MPETRHTNPRLTMEQTEFDNTVITVYDDGSVLIAREDEKVDVRPNEMEAIDALRVRTDEIAGVQG